VRVAALYDIHGNDAALAAVLAEIETLGVDLIVVGGDVAGGAFPCETVDAVRALGDRAITIRGNGERELIEARLRLDAGSARVDPDDVWSTRTHWAAGVLDRERLEWMGALPPLSSVEIDGLGDVLFCHGSPRSDEELVTVETPETRLAEALAGTSAGIIATAHTHVRYERHVLGRTLFNPGSVGMPYEGEPGAYWALLGVPGTSGSKGPLDPSVVEHRRTAYDLDETERRYCTSGDPMTDEMIEILRQPPTPAEVIAHAEALAFSG